MSARSASPNGLALVRLIAFLVPASDAPQLRIFAWLLRGLSDSDSVNASALPAFEGWRRRARSRGEEASEALHLLDPRSDPSIAALLDASWDDEPLIPEEGALEESRAECRRGEAVPLEEIRHEFS